MHLLIAVAVDDPTEELKDLPVSLVPPGMLDLVHLPMNVPARPMT